MDLQQLTTFCVIISDKNMTTAAHRLKITQPTVSRQIKLLEAELGVRLLERGRREVRPTLQGQLFFDYAQKILSLVQKAESAVRSVSDHLEGCVRVVTVNYLGMFFMAPIVCHFLKPNPKFKIQLSYLQPNEVIEKMQKSEIEAVIMPSLKKEYGVSFPHYERYPLFQDKMLFVGSRRDISLSESIQIQNLNERPLISFSNILPQFTMYLEQKKKEQGIQAHSIFEVNNLGIMKKIIETGKYWGFMPHSSIQKQIQTGRFSLVKVKDFEYEVDIEVYFLKQMKNKKLIEFLLLMLKKQAFRTQFSL